MTSAKYVTLPTIVRPYCMLTTSCYSVTYLERLLELAWLDVTINFPKNHVIYVLPVEVLMVVNLHGLLNTLALRWSAFC